MCLHIWLTFIDLWFKLTTKGKNHERNVIYNFFQEVPKKTNLRLL
jgi:hypothetical protein